MAKLRDKGVDVWAEIKRSGEAAGGGGAAPAQAAPRPRRVAVLWKGMKRERQRTAMIVTARCFMCKQDRIGGRGRIGGTEE